MCAHLSLRDCVGVTGLLWPLQALTELTHLDLYGCEGLEGDLTSLESLTQLTHLDLKLCSGLTGDLPPALREKFGPKAFVRRDSVVAAASTRRSGSVCSAGSPSTRWSAASSRRDESHRSEA